MFAIYEIIINPAAKKDRREKAGVNLYFLMSFIAVDIIIIKQDIRLR